jgi:rhamnosyltransferase subunit B
MLQEEGSVAMKARSSTQSLAKKCSSPTHFASPAAIREHQSLIVFSTLGTFGDVLPFILLGRHLRQRGHRIVFLANSNHEKFVRSHNFEFIAICDAEDPSSGVDPDTFMVREAIPAFRRTVEEIGVLAAEFSNIMIVNRAGNWGGIFASELYQLPHISVMLQPGAVSPGGQPISRRIFSATNDFRRAIGLPLLRKRRVVDRARAFISLFPDWFGFPESGLAEAGSCVGFPFAPEPPATLPPAVQALVSERGRLVVFTAGTNMPGTNFFELAGQFSARTGLPVVALGHEGETRKVAGVLASSFVDHASLFRFARVVVHNGGIGVTAQAMRAGVPQIVVPYVWDQPHNAKRVEELGIGRTILPADLSCERVIEVYGQIEALKRKPREDVARAVRRADAITEASELIERHTELRIDLGTPDDALLDVTWRTPGISAQCIIGHTSPTVAAQVPDDDDHTVPAIS